MTLDDIARDKPIREVLAFAGHEVLFQGQDAPMLLRLRNDRNDFEVLVATEKVAELAPILTCDEAKVLTGFWRRRSGFRPDGSRRYVWCLVVLDAHPDPADRARAA